MHVVYHVSLKQKALRRNHLRKGRRGHVGENLNHRYVPSLLSVILESAGNDSRLLDNLCKNRTLWSQLQVSDPGPDRDIFTSPFLSSLSWSTLRSGPVRGPAVWTLQQPCCWNRPKCGSVSKHSLRAAQSLLSTSAFKGFLLGLVAEQNALSQRLHLTFHSMSDPVHPALLANTANC